MFEPDATDKLVVSWKSASIYVPATTSTFENFKASAEMVLEKLKKADIVGFIDAAKHTFGKIDQGIMDADLAGISGKLEETLNTMQAEVTQLGNKARQTLRTADGARMSH